MMANRASLPPELLPFADLIRRAQCNLLTRRTLHIPLSRSVFVTSNPNATIRNSLNAILSEEPPDPARLRGLADSLRLMQQALTAPPTARQSNPANSNGRSSPRRK